MAQKHRKRSHDLASDAALAELTGAIRALLTIEGVQGIGEPVTLLSLPDLPPDILGVIERLQGGGIEVGEEMLIVTLSRSSGRGKKAVLRRLREALILLGRHARNNGATCEDVVTLLDDVKRVLTRTGT